MTCERCGEYVQQGKTKDHRLITLDLEPDPLGRLFFNDQGVVVAYHRNVGRSVPRYNQHFCDEPAVA